MLRLSWDQISWFWQVSWLDLEKGLDGTAVWRMSVFPFWGRPSVEHAWHEGIRRWGGTQAGAWLDLCLEGDLWMELFLEAVISHWDFSGSSYLQQYCDLSGLALVVNLMQPRVIWEEKFQLRNCLDQFDLWLCLWRIALLINWCKRARPTVGSTTPEASDPSHIRKLAKHKQG